MTATSGTIAGWQFDNEKFFKGNVELNSSNGSIKGATIYAGTLDSATKDKRIKLNGYLSIGDGGQIGNFPSWNNGTDGIGLKYGDNMVHITESGAGLKGGTNASIIVGNDTINITNNAAGEKVGNVNI
jgi:hypothetical protein